MKSSVQILGFLVGAVTGAAFGWAFLGSLLTVCLGSFEPCILQIAIAAASLLFGIATARALRHSQRLAIWITAIGWMPVPFFFVGNAVADVLIARNPGLAENPARVTDLGNLAGSALGLGLGLVLFWIARSRLPPRA